MIRIVEGAAMNATRCACGFTEDETGDYTMTDHLLAEFAPDDDTGADGLVHLEGEQQLTCTCGLAAATAAELDAHFVAIFTPANGIGHDGKKHHHLTGLTRD
jgi:hypothetical protein